MRVRWLAALTLALLSSGVGSARADAIPPPGRPEWDDTPMPMPSDPDEVFALMIGVAVVALLALATRAVRRRARCAR